MEHADGRVKFSVDNDNQNVKEKEKINYDAPDRGDGDIEKRLEDAKYYRVDFGYMPEEFEFYGGKYHFKNGNCGLTIEGYSLDIGLNEFASESHIEIEAVEEYNVGDRSGFLLRRKRAKLDEDRADAYHVDGFDREVYTIFEDENMMFHIWVGLHVSDAELEKIVQNMKLSLISYEEGMTEDGTLKVTDAFTWKDREEANKHIPGAQEETADGSIKETGISRVFQKKETSPMYQETRLNEDGDRYLWETRIDVTIESVEIVDDISALKKERFVQHWDDAWWSQYFTEDGTVLPYTRQIYEKDTLKEEYEMGRKLVLVTAKLENVSEYDTIFGVPVYEWLCVPGKLKTKNYGEGYVYEVFEERRTDNSLNSLEWEDAMIYTDHKGAGEKIDEETGNPKGYGSVWLKAGEQEMITLGYLIDDDMLDRLYMLKPTALTPMVHGTTPVLIPLTAN
ncbi:MAG: hypothetical protein IKU83_00985 [Lachnospiraceae bacterium]|nr:hypothetical protein [Lachnospiraceae bacterium]